LLVSSHELDELEKLTDHVAIMARGRIAAVGPVAEIRDRLDNHPLTVRVDVEPASGRNGKPGGGPREMAAALPRLPDVVGVQRGEGREPGLHRVVVGARNPQRFFRELGRVVLEEWFDVRRVETLDDSTEAVLGYLLGGRG